MPSNRIISDSSSESTPTPTQDPTHSSSSSSSQPQPSLESLTIGTPDQITALSKHAPLVLPNQLPDQPYAETLQALRCSYNYTFVMNWLCNFRGFLKLQSEFFDVDIFELELLNYFPDPATLYDNYDVGATGRYSSSPPPYPASGASMLFINRLKLSLMHFLMGNKNPELSFEQVVRQNFGISTPLGGVAEESVEIKEDGDDIEEGDVEKEAPEQEKQQQQHQEQQEQDVAGIDTAPSSNDAILPQFDYLLIEDKIEVLYIVISYIATSYKFKDWIDRQAPNQPEFSRVDPIFVTENTYISNKTTKEASHSQWLLLFDNARLYKRTIGYPDLEIPKKRKNSPEFPQDHYPASKFDVSKSQIQFELIAKNIFELNTYLTKLKSNRFTTSPRVLISKLTRSKLIDSIFNNEIKKRKFIASRKKEVQLAGLLAVRKRSSRLEARQEREKLLRQQQVQSSQSQSSNSHGEGGGDNVRVSGERRLRDVSNGRETPDPKLDSQRRFERRQQRHNRW
ncbi:hypothetical protein KGF57_003899 [Candida theae]|uniref:Uncharacterized protein n=1 Tax=Candida theae TaxID=1198502 RepID=A0AAD5BCJ9_9ASCO|nr:uncharacterized protein KGF57_003899 [Candida theae]KAI5954874.1 hypothetical protein KGF57_003899 [Candida theae]